LWGGWWVKGEERKVKGMMWRGDEEGRGREDLQRVVAELKKSSRIGLKTTRSSLQKTFLIFC
jgi:hypothetical protein